MSFIADLHIHSYLSRATSRELDLEHINIWAQIKGVNVVGTGDFTHPRWLAEIKERLEPAGEGIYRLKEHYRTSTQQYVPRSCQGSVYFLLSAEISSIYKRHGRTRKVHNILLVPTMDLAERIALTLARLGNVEADGRPILGLDSRDLLEILLEASEEAYLIPAHIWTPWFSVLGSKSGFDDLEECFGDLTPKIFALETGLSSDPLMNWRLSKLDPFTLVSNSDAHSPSKLAREANIFDTDLSFSGIREALRSGKGFLGTIEFFPEEGKYHYDGHRKCSTRMNPRETIASGGLCPVCKKPVTVGVMHRVEQLADRPEGFRPERSHPYISLLSLSEVIAQAFGVGANTKKVQERYLATLGRLGSELAVLREVPLDEIERLGSPLIQEGIRRVRAGDVKIAAGYDGEFGRISLFDDQERLDFSSQQMLIQVPKKVPRGVGTDAGKERFTLPVQSMKRTVPEEISPSLFSLKEIESGDWTLSRSLNPSQKDALNYDKGPLMIIAGPGTGKTFTLTHRIAHILSKGTASPSQVLAITFTNKAAQEMRERLEEFPWAPRTLRALTIGTFHGLCLRILREQGPALGLPSRFSILDDEGRSGLLRQLLSDHGLKDSSRNVSALLDLISQAKERLLRPNQLAEMDEDIPGISFSRIFHLYQDNLQRQKLLDYDDLIFLSVQLFQKAPEVLNSFRERFQWIFVDEYQDINYAQYRLIRLIAPAGSNLCVIGDPDQAIYGFRGSDVAYFFRFQEDYPNCKLIYLDQSYRSTEVILKASGQVVSKNVTTSLRRPIHSDILGKEKVIICALPTERAEADYVVEEIERMIGGTSHLSIDRGRIGMEDDQEEMGFKDFAVLYRLNVQGEAFEEAFKRSGIPFQRIRDGAWLIGGEARGILAYLRVLNNPFRDGDLLKVLSALPDRIGKKELYNLKEWCIKRGLTLWEGLRSSEAISWLDKDQKAKIRIIINELEDLSRMASHHGVMPLIQEGIKRMILGIDQRSPALRQFLSHVSSSEGSVDEFLTSMNLKRDVDRFDYKAEKVTLMTLHASKGLEFPVVFIIGCEEGLLPYMPQGKRPFSLEEERRLFYVGMTRAKRRLFLTRARGRVLFGKRINPGPSPFLEDVEEGLKEIREAPKRSSGRARDPQLSLF